MSKTLTGPIVVPVEEQRYVMVGDPGEKCAQVPVTVDEWVASRLDSGDRVWVEIMPMTNGALNFGSPARSFLGLVRRSWFYDGVILDVYDMSDIDWPEPVSVFCRRDHIWPERGVICDD